MSDKLAFVRQRCSLCEAGAAPKSRPFFKLYMDTNRKQTDKTDKKPRTPSYKYSFRLNEEQNIRFNELLCKAGSEHNRSRFIVKRIFKEEFVVLRRNFEDTIRCPAERLLFPVSETCQQLQSGCKSRQCTLFKRHNHATNCRSGAADARAESPEYRNSEPGKTG